MCILLLFMHKMSDVLFYYIPVNFLAQIQESHANKIRHDWGKKCIDILQNMVANMELVM